MAPRRPATPRSSVRDHREAPEPATGFLGGQDAVLVVVPGKPLSVNRATRAVLVRGRSMALKSAEAREFLVRAQVAARQAMRGRAPLDGDLELSVVAYWPRRGADSDAALKPVKDALQGIVYANDRLVCQDHSRREHDPVNPRTEVTVRAWRPAPAEWHDAWEGTP